VHNLKKKIAHFIDVSTSLVLSWHFELGFQVEIVLCDDKQKLIHNVLIIYGHMTFVAKFKKSFLDNTLIDYDSR